MKTSIIRSLALALGFSVATVAQAQNYGYPAAPGYAQQPPAGYAQQPPASVVPVHPQLQQPASYAQLQQPAGYAPQQPAGYAPQQPAGAAGSPSQPSQAAKAWNNYQPPDHHAFRTASTGSGVAQQPEVLPTPDRPMQQTPPLHGQPTPLQGSGYGPAPSYSPAIDSATHSAPGDDAHCTDCNGPHQVGQAYTGAAAGPWSGSAPLSYGAPLHHAGPKSWGLAPASGPAPLRNWFAGGNLLFLDLQENCDRRLLFDSTMPLGTALSSGQVDPGSSVAFETFFGRYFNCGQHALMVNYFFFNPSSELAAVGDGMPSDYRVAMPSWQNIMHDVDGDGMPAGDMSMYDLFDGNARYRTSRDVSFQGIELNLVSFGLGGARRAACGPLGVACGGCGPDGACGGNCGPTPGCGGACGPMIPACNTKLQLQTTHGLRWFQFKDRFEFATSRTDQIYGSTTDDMYYNVDAENNLFGYQFGARLDYCLGHRLNVYAGTKMGIYANDAQVRSRLGSTTTAGYVSAYYPTIQGQAVAMDNSETVLATLGELDLGLGYRINPCWSVRGGYRLYGISGVATSVGSIASDTANLPHARQVCADDSLILQGGYIGAEYNW